MATVKGIATVELSPNLALNKYWGTRQNAPKNTPVHNNIAVVLGGLSTRTTVRIGGDRDSFLIRPDVVSGKAYDRLKEHADFMREEMGFDKRIEMVSDNSYPTSSGLASSAAGFAALTLATARAVGYEGTERDLSRIARHGSGSACRSIPYGGGFIEWIADDGYASQLAEPGHWSEFRVVVGIATESEKPVSSQEAMKKSQDSNIWNVWEDVGRWHNREVRRGVLEKDMQILGPAVENNAELMHRLIRSVGTDYWNSSSWKISEAVKDLRTDGMEVYWTSDAGPHVKAICLEQDIRYVEKALLKSGALRTIVSYPGEGPRYIDAHLPPVKTLSA